MFTSISKSIEPGKIKTPLSNSKLLEIEESPSGSECYHGEASCSEYENELVNHILPHNYFKFEGG
jgi:hypothetical protein